MEVFRVRRAAATSPAGGGGPRGGRGKQSAGVGGSLSESSPLKVGVMVDRADVVQQLLASGEDVNQTDKVRVMDNDATCEESKWLSL